MVLYKERKERGKERNEQKEGRKDGGRAGEEGGEGGKGNGENGEKKERGGRNGRREEWTIQSCAIFLIIYMAWGSKLLSIPILFPEKYSGHSSGC